MSPVRGRMTIEELERDVRQHVEGIIGCLQKMDELDDLRGEQIDTQRRSINVISDALDSQGRINTNVKGRLAALEQKVERLELHRD